MLFFTGVAHAMGSKGAGGGGGGIEVLVLPLLFFGIFYLLVFRPQQKQAKKQREFLQNLKIGDRVVTSGGIHGEVKGLTETTVTLEIAPKIPVKVTRSAVTGRSQDAAVPEAKPVKE
ncbi:MAG: preprotein translocase subunit YajC [Deltaproteobacteria bacterium]|nr:preprotein translocase subunit YajC [Deltaproteobacteria bacterium]